MKSPNTLLIVAVGFVTLSLLSENAQAGEPLHPIRDFGFMDYFNYFASIFGF